MMHEIAGGMTAYQAVAAAIQQVESAMRSNDRQLSDMFNRSTQIAADIAAKEAQQRELGAQLEGLRIAHRRVVMGDASLAALVAGDDPHVD